MQQFEVTVRDRQERGKGPVGRLRRAGWIPAVIYGHGSPARALAVEKGGLERFLETGHHLVELKQEGDGEVETAPVKALVREVQVQPVTQEVLHVDFIEVAEHERVQLAMSLVFRGEPAGLKEGGVFSIILHEIEIECSADSVVDELRVDVSGLALGDSLHVREVSLPEGVTAVIDGEQVVATVRLPKGEVAEEVAEVEGEAAQPEVISEKKREDREKEKEAD